MLDKSRKEELIRQARFALSEILRADAIATKSVTKRVSDLVYQSAYQSLIEAIDTGLPATDIGRTERDIARYRRELRDICERAREFMGRSRLRDKHSWKKMVKDSSVLTVPFFLGFNENESDR